MNAKAKASSSRKGVKKSTQKLSKTTLKAAKQHDKQSCYDSLDDLSDDERAELFERIRLRGIEGLYTYDDDSDSLYELDPFDPMGSLVRLNRVDSMDGSEKNYEKLSADYDLLVSDVMLLKGKKKLWNTERESLQKHLSLLKVENETLQKKVAELESRLESSTNASQSRQSKKLQKVNAPQAPNVINSALKPSDDSGSAVVESKTKEPAANEKSAAKEKPKSAPPKQTSQQQVGNKGRKKHSQDVIYVVPASGQSFTDLVRALRKSELFTVCFMVDTPRRVANDVLLVPCKRTADSAKVESMIKESVGDLGKVTKKTPMTTLTSTNFDGFITALEVQKAIVEQHDINVEVSNIKLQKTRKGRQEARIKLPIRNAPKLEGNRLVIGKSTVTFQTVVPKSLEEERCFRCMGLGHRAAQCQKSQILCYRCGMGGHTASGCKNTPKCLVCDGEHPTGSRKCVPSSQTENPTDQASE